MHTDGLVPIWGRPRWGLIPKLKEEVVSEQSGVYRSTIHTIHCCLRIVKDPLIKFLTLMYSHQKRLRHVGSLKPTGPKTMPIGIHRENSNAPTSYQACLLPEHSKWPILVLNYISFELHKVKNGHLRHVWVPGRDTAHSQDLVWIPGLPGARSMRKQASHLTASRMPVVETVEAVDNGGDCEDIIVEDTVVEDIIV